MLCDSNIIIYAANPADSSTLKYVEASDAAIASITRIEVLGYPGFAALPEPIRQLLLRTLNSLDQIPLDDEIITTAIQLRQNKKMTLADSIIAATALVHRLVLVTRNVADFKHIEEISIVNPFDEAS